jgi:predicted DCC family thiol-disulfide oxidoreductase YuxK
MASAHGTDVVILYDEDCGFCRWSMTKILAWDRRGRIRPVPLQAPESDGLLGGMDAGRRMASWHLIAPDGRIHSAGAAVAPLLRLLPGGGPLARLAAAFPAATERLYRLIARNRGLLGRLVGGRACSVDPSRGRR